MQYGYISVIDNSSSPDQLYSFFKNNKMHVKMNPAIPSADPGQWAQFMKRIATRLFEDKKGLWESNIGELATAIRSDRCPHECVYGRCFTEYLSINYNGDVSPCERFFGLNDYSDYIIGNINEDSPEEIVFGDRRSELIAQVHQRRSDCQDCEWFKICGSGCSHSNLACGNKIESRDRYCEARQDLFRHIKQLVGG
jgi:radical SAM protein with 4Fe4S-binding SPASM domain